MSKMPTVAEAQAELLRRVRTEGVLAAYEASLAICQDENAPAPARATASSTLFRVAGYFNKENTGGSEKELHEMTADELSREIRKLEAGIVSPEYRETKVDVFG